MIRAICCKNEEEAKTLLKVLDMVGYYWRWGERLVDEPALYQAGWYVLNTEDITVDFTKEHESYYDILINFSEGRKRYIYDDLVRCLACLG